VADLTVFELAWLVGILEGEGTFRYNSTQYIALKMTDEDIVSRAAKIFEIITGKSFVVKRMDMRHVKNAQDAFWVQLSGDAARLVMRTIVSHMGCRRRKRIWQCLNEHKEEKIDLVSLLKIKELAP
jgi:hypothetical protein